VQMNGNTFTQIITFVYADLDYFNCFK